MCTKKQPIKPYSSFNESDYTITLNSIVTLETHAVSTNTGLDVSSFHYTTGRTECIYVGKV